MFNLKIPWYRSDLPALAFLDETGVCEYPYEVMSLPEE